jgi:hypothetical protein
MGGDASHRRLLQHTPVEQNMDTTVWCEISPPTAHLPSQLCGQILVPAFRGGTASAGLPMDADFLEATIYMVQRHWHYMGLGLDTLLIRIFRSLVAYTCYSLMHLGICSPLNMILLSLNSQQGALSTFISCHSGGHDFGGIVAGKAALLCCQYHRTPRTSEGAIAGIVIAGTIFICLAGSGEKQRNTSGTTTVIQKVLVWDQMFDSRQHHYWCLDPALTLAGRHWHRQWFGRQTVALANSSPSGKGAELVTWKTYPMEDSASSTFIGSIFKAQQ